MNMRFNKQELAALASQTFQNFDREGVLVLKEKSEGFFRKSEGCSVRWFRLKGNLLFYLKGPEPLHEPLGVIVLGQHTVKEQNLDENGYWPFHIVWENGVCYRIATYSEADRTNWIKAIQNAPYSVLQSQLNSLKERLNSIRSTMDIATYRMQKGIVCDIYEIPICELVLSCDNLLCDAYGKPPSPQIVVYVRYSKDECVKYDTTEVVENCSNPCFSKTILFRGSDGLTGKVIVQIVVYDVKEQVTETAVPMGSTSLTLSTIQEAQRLRVSLMNRENKTIGFVTIHGWSLEPSHLGASPSHSEENNSTDVTQKVLCHRRSQSLPPRLGLKLKFPSFCSLLKKIFVNGYQVTYRFHSGLGGDITVHEIMSETKLCFQIPESLLRIFITREKKLLRELESIKNLSDHWRSRQNYLANTHIFLMQHYNCSKASLLNAWTKNLKPSCMKNDCNLVFAPVNLHLQRMWVHNDTLNRTGFYNVVTAGAFTVHEQRTAASGGLIRLVQQVKEVGSHESASHLANGNKIQENFEYVLTIQRLCTWACDDMKRTLFYLRSKRFSDVVERLEALKKNVRNISALWMPALIEEALAGIGWPENDRTSDSFNETTTRVRSVFEVQESDIEAEVGSGKSSEGFCSMFKEMKLDINIPCPDPTVAIDKKEADSAKATTSASSDLQFHYDHFESEEPLDTQMQSLEMNVNSEHKSLSPERTPPTSFASPMGNENKQMFKIEVEPISEPTSTPSEPLDPSFREKKLEYLTQLGSDVLARTREFLRSVERILAANPQVMSEKVISCMECLLVEMVLDTETLMDWAKVGHAALRILCEPPSWTCQQAALRIRRDTCFSQALTTVMAGLLCWLNSAPGAVIVKTLTSELGPLCGFEGLLSLYSTEKAMWGDMVVAVEDLQTVVFQLARSRPGKRITPRVCGRNNAIVVEIPVSDWIYSEVSSKGCYSFTITTVFFNIGINEKASLAEGLGETTPQYQSNCDNFNMLKKYYKKYKETFPIDYMAASRASSRAKPLEEVMANLEVAVKKKVPKNVEVLQLSSLATRLMNGVRFTSCKSAKDRTGMAVTLEQRNILASEYHLADNEMKKALNIMRSEGCRRENTIKNVGVRKYAFTKKQVMALPEDYQPPPGTYGSTET